MGILTSRPILVVSLYIKQKGGWEHHQMLKCMTHHVMTLMVLLNSNAHTPNETSHHRIYVKINFYCELFTGTFHLKRNHNYMYYHQVQLQLYVGSDMFSWCDFCVYTPVDVAVERIYPCKEWQSTCIPKLEEYYDKYIILEILDPLYKPSYIW